MSRFDYADPGTDSAYCDPFAPEQDDDQDPAETDAHDVLSALASFRAHAEGCTDFERLMTLWAQARELSKAALDVSSAISSQVDRVVERRR